MGNRPKRASSASPSGDTETFRRGPEFPATDPVCEITPVTRPRISAPLPWPWISSSGTPETHCARAQSRYASHASAGANVSGRNTVQPIRRKFSCALSAMRAFSSRSPGEPVSSPGSIQCPGTSATVCA